MGDAVESKNPWKTWAILHVGCTIALVTSFL